MTSNLIVCPSCRHRFPLTASLAAPYIAEARLNFAKQLANKDVELAKKGREIRLQQNGIARAHALIDKKVALRLTAERSRLLKVAEKKAHRLLAQQLKKQDREAVELRRLVARSRRELASARKAETKVLRKQRLLDEARRKLSLTVERRVEASAGEMRRNAEAEAEETFGLRLAEKDEQLALMSRTIEDLRLKASQGSELRQGEALELKFERNLRTQFPTDSIEPVPKGEVGADLIQRVNGAIGQSVGILLWELKRTKAWSDKWLSKVREDQRRCRADVAIISSVVLPVNVDGFGLLDGVWIAHPRYALAIAVALRNGIVELADAKGRQQGQLTKMEHMFAYLTGLAFRQRVEAIVENFTSMQEDLDRERKYLTHQWAKRERQLHGVLESTSGMVGDLKGIAGKSMPELSMFDAPALGILKQTEES